MSIRLQSDLPIPPYDERASARQEGREHITVTGALAVPVEQAYMGSDPVREGWKPYFVAINLERSPQKWVYFKQIKEAA